MNPNNVIQYGMLASEATNVGGVKAYKVVQQQLVDAVKRNSFNERVKEGRNQLVLWLLILGVITGGLETRQFVSVLKMKFDSHREKREKLKKEAITAEKILVDNFGVT